MRGSRCLCFVTRAGLLQTIPIAEVKGVKKLSSVSLSVSKLLGTFFVALACALFLISVSAFAKRADDKNTAAPSLASANTAALDMPQQGGAGRGGRGAGGGRGEGGAYGALHIRNIGPSMISGRIQTIAVDPTNKRHFYIGAASGGVWRTLDGGITFTPVFDDQTSYSIGYVAIDPKNPSVVWVGTGENNSQRSVSYGDGLYRSEDDGHTWKKMGLEHSEHIARVIIDPRNSDTVFVAAQGPLWGGGGDRGLYKTTDGGKTWKNVLSINEHTGVTDVAFVPGDPDVMYAAAYQRGTPPIYFD